jgi:hypothetical protein
VVSTSGGHFVAYFETRSGKRVSIPAFAPSESFTHLDFLLTQSDPLDNLYALAFVRLGVLLICSFKDRVIFRAVRRMLSIGFQTGRRGPDKGRM